MKVNPYLSFDGTCKEAFEFYAKCLRGEIVMMMTYGQTPMADEMPAVRDRIAHARLVIGDQVLMASDSWMSFDGTKGMTVSLMVETPAEAERIFKALSENGQITMPLEPTFWAHRFGMVTDRFGIPWMVNCEIAAQKVA